MRSLSWLAILFVALAVLGCHSPPPPPPPYPGGVNVQAPGVRVNVIDPGPGR